MILYLIKNKIQKMTDLQKEKIYDTYKSKVFSYIQSKVRNIQNAEDLTADVFVKVYEKIDTFDESKAALSTWIYQITKNKVIDFFRTQKQFAELTELPDGSTSIEDSICKAETLELLASALKKLDEREKNIIVLHFYSGKTLKEIASGMGISYSYIKVLLNDAYEKLKECLS